MPSTSSLATQPAELDLDSATRLRATLGRLARRLRPTEAGAAAGLTPTRVSILLTVVRAGPIGLSALAEAEGLNPTMLSRAISRLVDAGLLAARQRRRRPPLGLGAEHRGGSPAGRAHAPRAHRCRSMQALDGLPEHDARLIERALPLSRGWPSSSRAARNDAGPASAGRTTFAALAVPNYRRYFGGQAISLIGTWMQMTAQSWLVLTLTHSSTALGLIIALQTLPVLLLGPYGGVIADRVNKRRMMIALQSAMGLQALIARPADRHGLVTLGRSACSPPCSVSTTPSRIPPASRSCWRWSAPSICATRSASTRCWSTWRASIGPAVAGILIATVGDGVCFLVNAGQLRGRGRLAGHMDRAALLPTAPTRAPAASCARACATSARTPDAGRAAADDGHRRLPDLRVPGHRCRSWPSRGLHVGASGFWLHDRRDGRRRRRRRPVRLPRAGRPACGLLVAGLGAASASP